MKKIILMVLLLLIAAGVAQARVSDSKYQYGVGVILGEPNGFSGKYWLNNKEAYDLSISIRMAHVYFIQGAYLYHNYDVFKNLTALKNFSEASLYYGAGLSLIIDSEHRFNRRDENDTYDNLLGVKGTVGISYMIPQQPFEVFFEVSPIFNLTPVSNFNFAGGVGVRYSF